MNQTVLTACIAELSALRYTPAGLPALDLLLEHSSQLTEADHFRQVNLTIRARSLGDQAERLSRQIVGSQWRFQGFLATSRQSRSVVFHIQEFQQN